MTEKEKKFCEEYVLCWNTREAYGKVFNSTNDGSSYILKKKDCAEYIEKLKQEIPPAVICRAEDIIIGIQEMAFDKKIGNRERIKAFELLGKYFNLFVNQTDINITNAKINVDLSDVVE